MDTGIWFSNSSSETAGNDKRKGPPFISFGIFCVVLSGSASRLDRQPGRTLPGSMEGRTGKYKRGSLLHHLQPPEETQSAYL